MLTALAIILIIFSIIGFYFILKAFSFNKEHNKQGVLLSLVFASFILMTSGYVVLGYLV